MRDGDGERPIETRIRDVQPNMNRESVDDLRRAGRLSAEIRRMRLRMPEAVAERRRLLLAASERKGPGRARIDAMGRMTGLAPSVVNHELHEAREERAVTNGKK